MSISAVENKIKDVLFGAAHRQCACVGSVCPSVIQWISLVNTQCTAWILRSVFKPFLWGGKKKPMSEWLTRTEKAPERPELPRLDSSVSIPLLARITWRWNKMTLAFLVLFQQANSPNSSSALGASPAEGLCSCRGWGESRNRRGIWIYACSSSYSLLEPRVVCSCRSTETKQAQNRIESLSNYRLHPHNNSTAFQSTIFGGKIP